MKKLTFILGLCLSMLFFGAVAMAGQYSVMIMVSDSSGQAEADVIKSNAKIGSDSFNFTQINTATGGTRPIAGSVKLGDEIASGKVKLSAFDMIWLTWNGPGHDGDYFMAGAEAALLKFVEDGGIIYMSAFDDNYKDAKGNMIGGWMPIDKYPATISNTGDSELTLTPAGEATGIFKGVNLSGLVLDDNFNTKDPAYTVLATRNDNSQIAAFLLKYGKGAYLGVCTDARSTFPAATPMVTNALGYMASLRALSAASVEHIGKLATTWARIK